MAQLATFQDRQREYEARQREYGVQVVLKLNAIFGPIHKEMLQMSAKKKDARTKSETRALYTESDGDSEFQPPGCKWIARKVFEEFDAPEFFSQRAQKRTRMEMRRAFSC